MGLFGRQWQKGEVVAAVVLASGAVAAAVVGIIPAIIDDPPSPPTEAHCSPDSYAEIHTPAANSKIARAVTIGGVAKMDGADRFWVVVRGSLSKRFYAVSSTPIVPDVDRTYSVATIVGSTTDSGKEFTITALSATPAASRQLGENSGAIGMAALPAGTCPIVSIKVTRR